MMTVLSMMIWFVFIFYSVSFAEEIKSHNDEDKKENNYVIAPMVLSNPNIGSGGGVTLLYFYSLNPDDKVSPNSSVKWIFDLCYI